MQPMDARIVWQVDKLFMVAAQTVGGVGGQEQREHAAQLLLQTGPVSSVDAEALLIRPRCTRSKMCCWQRRRTITPPLFWVQPLQLCSQQALGVACSRLPRAECQIHTTMNFGLYCRYKIKKDTHTVEA